MQFDNFQLNKIFTILVAHLTSVVSSLTTEVKIQII